MRDQEVRLGQWIASLGAVVLILSLFLRWYGLALPAGAQAALDARTEQLPPAYRDFGEQFSRAMLGAFAGVGGTAWKMFGWEDLALLACAIVALLSTLLALGLGSSIVHTNARQLAQASALVGTIAAGIVLVKMFDQPDPAELFALQTGPYLALAGAGAMAIGGWAAGGH